MFGFFFPGFYVSALAIFAPQARLRGDPLYSAQKQQDLDLNFNKEPTKWPGTCWESVPAPGGRPGEETKLVLAGHYGRGSVSARANGLDSSKELPCPQSNSLIEEIVERNAQQWTVLFDAIRAAVIIEFEDEFQADVSNWSKSYGNV